MTELIKIEINRDNVVIEKAIVLRPEHIGVKEWTEFWESAREADKGSYTEGYDEGYEKGYADGGETGWDEGYQACVRDKDEEVTS